MTNEPRKHSTSYASILIRCQGGKESLRDVRLAMEDALYCAKTPAENHGLPVCFEHKNALVWVDPKWSVDDLYTAWEAQVARQKREATTTRGGARG